MGFTHVAVRLLHSDAKDTYNADFLVDTGAMDTIAPASALKKIGIKPVGRDEYELANGTLSNSSMVMPKWSLWGK